MEVGATDGWASGAFRVGAARSTMLFVIAFDVRFTFSVIR